MRVAGCGGIFVQGTVLNNCRHEIAVRNVAAARKERQTPLGKNAEKQLQDEVI